MRAVIIGLVVVAVMLAGGTAYLLRDYLSAMQAELEASKPKAPTTNVLVAAADMPVGTVVNENNTDWIKWPQGEVPDGFIERTPDNNPLDEIGKEKHLARRGFVKGEPITMDRLYKSDDPGFLRGALKPGMRAVAVRASAENAASGFILPNDHIDILLTHSMVDQLQQKMTDGEAEGEVPALRVISETILHNLRVLAVDQKVNEFEGGAVIARTVLLEVTPKQAEIIEAAKDMGSLTLLLRSAEEGTEPDRDTFTTDMQISPIMRNLLDIGVESSSMPSPTPTVESPASDGAASSGPPAMPAPAPILDLPSTSSSRAPSTSSAPAKAAPEPPRDITIYRGGQGGVTQ